MLAGNAPNRRSHNKFKVVNKRFPYVRSLSPVSTCVSSVASCMVRDSGRLAIYRCLENARTALTRFLCIDEAAQTCLCEPPKKTIRSKWAFLGFGLHEFFLSRLFRMSTDKLKSASHRGLPS